MKETQKKASRKRGKSRHLNRRQIRVNPQRRSNRHLKETQIKNNLNRSRNLHPRAQQALAKQDQDCRLHQEYQLHYRSREGRRDDTISWALDLDLFPSLSFLSVLVLEQ